MTTPTTDLTTEADIAELVRRFYGDVAQDDPLGPLFEDVAKVTRSKHTGSATQLAESASGTQDAEVDNCGASPKSVRMSNTVVERDA